MLSEYTRIMSWSGFKRNTCILLLPPPPPMVFPCSHVVSEYNTVYSEKSNFEVIYQT